MKSIHLEIKIGPFLQLKCIIIYCNISSASRTINGRSANAQGVESGGVGREPNAGQVSAKHFRHRARLPAEGLDASDCSCSLGESEL